MKTRILLVAALALLIPVLASAQNRKTTKELTVKDVVELSRSDLGDEVILSQIEASGTVFKLTVDDILELNAGVQHLVHTGADLLEFFGNGLAGRAPDTDRKVCVAGVGDPVERIVDDSIEQGIGCFRVRMHASFRNPSRSRCAS